MIQDDFSVAANGDIRYIGDAHGVGTPGYYTVIEFHRFLQDLADDAVALGDDLLDITGDTPSERSTDNIISLLAPYNINDASAEHLYDGSITQNNGDTIYSGLVVVGAVEPGTQLQIVQNNTLLTNYWTTGINTDPNANILLRLMVKTRNAGLDIDGRRLRIQAREIGSTYAEFSLTAGLGNATAAIFTSADLNNQTDPATIATWTTIANTEGLNLLDIDGNGLPESYYSQWNKDIYTINDLYERTKWLQRRGTAETLYGISGELFRGVTHSFAYNNEALGPFTQNEILTFGNGSTGLLLAFDDQGTTGNLYIQLLTGGAPNNGATISGGTSGTTADISSVVTSRTISPSFIGNSTGTAIIGAYGVGINPANLTANDQLFDLTNTLIVPPNNVTFTVNGLVIGEDRVLVGPQLGGVIDVNQLTANGEQTIGASTFVVNQVIPTDTPASGTIRVFNGDTFDRIEYTSYTASTFTINGTLPATYATATILFISYIDKLATSTSESFTSVFLSTRSLFIRVRDGGITPIKTFETTGTLGSAGGSTTVIRTSDE
jgi:hypothetical protein